MESYPFRTFREHYPILAKKLYLASHSLGAVPKEAGDALQEYLDAWASQGIEAWSGPWFEAIRHFQRQIEILLRADAGTVVPMENVTRGMAAVSSCFDFTGTRNRVVMTDLEFSTSYPFWRGVTELGAELVIVRSEDGITVPTEKLIDAIDDRTLIVPTSHVYFRSGALQDLKAVTGAAHRMGAYVIGDGYQAVGTVPVDVSDLEIDFYVGGSHKWLCGGPGAGFLYVRQDLIPSLRPKFMGWFGIEGSFEYKPGTDPKPADGVMRFMGGTPALPALYAAREGIRLVLEAGINPIRDYSKALTSYIIDQADERRFEVRTPRDPDARSGMVCIEFEGSETATQGLLARDVIVDWRPNCGIRISPHFYNTFEEVQSFFSTLDEVTRRR